MKVGFFSLLGLLFIGLKLGGVITWSWVWVTIPLWGRLGLFFGLMALVVVAAFVSAMLKD